MISNNSKQIIVLTNSDLLRGIQNFIALAAGFDAAWLSTLPASKVAEIVLLVWFEDKFALTVLLARAADVTVEGITEDEDIPSVGFCVFEGEPVGRGLAEVGRVVTLLSALLLGDLTTGGGGGGGGAAVVEGADSGGFGLGLGVGEGTVGV